ncbi:MAG: ribonuclease P protein component [bacterium]
MTDSAIDIRPLRKRADFLRLRYPEQQGGYRKATSSFLLQAAPGPNAEHSIRLGLTVTKKLGSAVRRNRIRRRLRAAAKSILPLHGQPNYDYVFIARGAAFDLPFQQLLDDIRRATLNQHK